ncbi:hypothetical protein WJX74_006925 [Apatococcus lobatus]|uniref:H/ACA ribonucleoprotein complex subunit 2 n=1 Tax=Apatococcus lobatus TaxID=904363 RepID=A0AAW1RHE3_9CHLO
MAKDKEKTSTPAKEAVQKPEQRILAPIAKPLADDKMNKRVLKLVKKASKRKQVKRGVKEVVKSLRKNTVGVCIIAGDISPIDVITHLPVLCEDHDIPYIFVPSKEDLGAAGMTKRPTSCMLVLPKPVKGPEPEDAQEYTEAYEDVHKRIKAVQPLY